MDDTEEVEKQNPELSHSFFSILIKGYRFVAKVFLYSIIMIMLFIGVLATTYTIDYVQNISKDNYKPLYGAYIIVSPSMTPAIKVQDAVIVKNVSPKRLKKGDIITFLSTDSRYAGLIVTHRIIDIEKSEEGKYLFRTKGDSNNTPDDALVTEDNIQGRVFLRIPKIGYLQYFLSQSYGWVVCIVIPCLAVIAFEIVKVTKATKNVVKKKVEKKKDKYKTKKQRKENMIELIDMNEDRKKPKKKQETYYDDIEVITTEKEEKKFGKK